MAMLWFLMLWAKCTVGEPSSNLLMHVNHTLVKRRENRKTIVPVYWHSMHDNENHKLTYATILHQIVKLNQAVANGNHYYQLHNIQFYNSAALTNLECCETPLERQMKRAYRQGGKESLNIFSANSGRHVVKNGVWQEKRSSISWATFPDSELEMDGVVISTDRLSYDSDYPTTLIHEVGHWAALLHVFRGGCSDPNNDYVADTPPVDERSRKTRNGKSAISWTWQCNAFINTCSNSPFTDNIYNFMDYTECRQSFTPGQMQRMDYYLNTFRPSQLSCTAASCTPMTTALYRAIQHLL